MGWFPTRRTVPFAPPVVRNPCAKSTRSPFQFEGISTRYRPLSVRPKNARAPGSASKAGSSSRHWRFGHGTGSMATARGEVGEVRLVGVNPTPTRTPQAVTSQRASEARPIMVFSSDWECVRENLCLASRKGEAAALDSRGYDVVAPRGGPSDQEGAMSSQGRSRRSFLVGSASGLSGAWFLANYPGILAAEEFVLEAERSEQQIGFAFFTPEQAAEVEAVAAQIIPTDETPGAREARVVRFIDRALVTFEKGRQPDYTRGIEELTAETRRRFPSRSRFSELTFDQQIELLTAIETTPFFNLVRTHTITGFFASPVHGGNYGKVGWALIGFDDALQFEPPFGYYDALPVPPAPRLGVGGQP
ncbi:MAG: gluconate 2-dehydrogenase subunit 3 family protein [Gemmatimonadetes bacterium]|nr:gluconate 2-dehydrogenase subunit 3 family protein [Gemmatimonadota bacterium]